MLIITTESGSIYEVDTDLSLIRRQTLGEPMRGDGQWRPTYGYGIPSMGDEWVFITQVANDPGVRTIRTTSRIVTITEGN